MPGHKRNETLNMINPYLIDITEIEGFDDLFHETGILKEGMRRAASLYGSDHTNYLIGGSSAGILAGISASTRKGDTILVARNCHKSVYNAIYLGELDPIYIYPEYDETFGINCGISPEKIEKMLITHPQIKLIIITSPTYEGVVSDIKQISKIAHKHNIPILIDEAHGAHLGFHSYFPMNSIQAGGDVVVHSLHKTLPSFTQTGLIHVNGELVDYDNIKRYLSIYQSTSPSYLLMAGIEQCISFLQEKKDEIFSTYGKRLQYFYKQIRQYKNIKILTKDHSVNQFFDLDPSKIVISVKNTNMTGTMLYQLLLNKYKIQVEMASKDYVLAMTSICDKEIGFERLYNALLEIDFDLMNKETVMTSKTLGHYDKAETEKIMTSYEAMNCELEFVSFLKSEGRISGEYVYLYPPGIPILVPGERITSVLIQELLRNKKMGLSIQGMKDYNLDKIEVVK